MTKSLDILHIHYTYTQSMDTSQLLHWLFRCIPSCHHRAGQRLCLNVDQQRNSGFPLPRALLGSATLLPPAPGVRPIKPFLGGNCLGICLPVISSHTSPNPATTLIFLWPSNWAAQFSDIGSFVQNFMLSF